MPSFVDRVLSAVDAFRGAGQVDQPHADGSGSGNTAFGMVFESLNDPYLADFLRLGTGSEGRGVSYESALRNPTFFRACGLVAGSIGMLPMRLIDRETKESVSYDANTLARLIHRRPNGYQSAFDFRAQMQLRAMIYGDAYALVLRGMDVRTGNRRSIRGLVPLDPGRVEAKLRANWTIEYKYTPANGSPQFYGPDQILHLKGPSLNGVNGFSLVRQAREAIWLALRAELAAAKIFQNGVIGARSIEVPQTLTPTAYEQLKKDIAELYSGAENAGSTPILQGGAKWSEGTTGKDAEIPAVRKMQIEEIARVTGVPRPLLMMDETSWGTGIEQLGRFFVTYALGPWFEAWQQSCERTLLDDAEADKYEFKFNPAALLRGSMKETAEYLATALGRGGGQAWMDYAEARETLDLPQKVIEQMQQQTAAPAPGRATEDEPDDQAAAA